MGCHFLLHRKTLGRFKALSEGSARSLCPCQGKQASLCPLPHPCPSAELTAREKFVVKGQQESFSWPFHSLISIQVTAPALCYKGHSHDTQGRGSVNQFLITKSTACTEFLQEPGTFIKRQVQSLLQHSLVLLYLLPQHSSPSKILQSLLITLSIY